MYSLFEEQIVHESKALDFFLSRGTESFAEALTYFPEMDNYNIGPEEYLEPDRRAQESGQYSGDRQPERGFHRRLDRLRQEDRRSRGRCP